MSRQLPPNANLDHLKKQAKALLGDLQRNDPQVKLADALHAVARDYGFPTWPVLKEHVERLARNRPELSASPFVGRWIADIARSKRHPANPIQRATLHFEVNGDMVAITHVMVDEQGREDRGEHTLNVDGVEHSPPDLGGYSFMARWLGPRIIETLAQRQGGPRERGVYEVSANGSTLTVRSAEQELVFERER